MKLSTEIRKEIEDLKNTLKALKEEGKTEEAYNKLGELKELENKLKDAELEETLAATNPGGEQVIKGKENKIDVNTIFNKLVLGKAVTAEEMEVYTNQVGIPGQVEVTDGKGGYLVPAEQFREIEEDRRTRTTLKNFCRVLPVNSNHGTVPRHTRGKGRLIKFDELTEINKSDIDFGQIEFKTGDYGDIVPSSNSLLEDVTVNLLDLIKDSFVDKSILTENDMILAIIAKAEKVAGSDWTILSTALNKELDPAISRASIIITNQTSFDWLDRQLDGNGRPLLTPDLADPTILKFRGREVVVMTDEELPVEPGKLTFYVGSLKDGVIFFDRKGVLIAISKEAGFTTNSTLVRAIERFDVKERDPKAVVHVEITPAAPAKK